MVPLDAPPVLCSLNRLIGVWGITTGCPTTCRCIVWRAGILKVWVSPRADLVGNNNLCAHSEWLSGRCMTTAQDNRNRQAEAADCVQGAGSLWSVIGG
jgi:hypothetical protein